LEVFAARKVTNDLYREKNNDTSRGVVNMKQ